MNDNRRTFFKKIFGAAIAIAIPIPVIRKKVEPTFNKMMFPMIRRTFPELIASELVSVQPMSGPTGMVFHMNYVYDKKEGVITRFFKRFFSKKPAKIEVPKNKELLVKKMVDEYADYPSFLDWKE